MAFSLLTGVAWAPPAAGAELLEIQLEELEIPLSLDQLDAWSRRAEGVAIGSGGGAGAGGLPAGAAARRGAVGAGGVPTALAGAAPGPPGAPAAEGPAPVPPQSDQDVWLDLLEPGSRRALKRLLQAPLLRDRSFGSQLLDTWAGGQMLDEAGDLLTTPDGRSTAPLLQATLRQLLRQRREVTTLTLLRAVPVPRLRLRLDSLLTLAEQWRQQIQLQGEALTALRDLSLPLRRSRPPVALEERRRRPQRLLLAVRHRREPLPIDLWPARQPEASRHPWLLVLPGLGGNADQLGWFAGALAGRGWSVAVPQHPGSDGRALKAALEGQGPTPGAETLAVRLQDVAAVLAARRQGQLPLPGEGVVLVGHSLGGLTALLAAGVEPQPGLAQRCRRALDRLPLGNPSRLLQCELVNTGLPAPLPRPDDLRGVLLFHGFGSLLWPQGVTAELPQPVLMVGGSLDLVTPPLEEQLQLFLPTANPRSRLVLVEGGSHFSPVRMVEQEEAVLRLSRDLVGVDPGAVQNLLLGIGREFLLSLETPLLLPAQVRSQEGVRAYVLDPAAARRWRQRLSP